MSAASTQLPPAEGRGSVSQAPHLPQGFNDTFISRYIETGELRLHAVIGGDGHWVTEEAPEEMLAALRDFLAPYREGGGGSL
jgi:pimeloyl-ACP methyl ester carboxylesterase